MNDRERNRVCDVLIVGSGAGGLSTAITAKKGGLKHFSRATQAVS